MMPVASPSKSPRVVRRRLLHHTVLAAISVGLVLLIYRVFLMDGSMQGRRPIASWSLATAYVGLGLIGVTLLIGPVNVLGGRRNPVSTYWRRDVGIWAGLVSLAHVGLGLLVHSDSILGNFFCDLERPNCLTTPVAIFRGGLWGFSNYLGLAGTGIVLLLLSLSSDVSLRRLRAQRWKRLQRWNYGLFVLVVIHAVAFQMLEDRAVPYPFVLAMAATIVVAGQGAAFWKRRRAAGKSQSSG